MSEIQVNSIKSLSGPLINLQSDILATGKTLDVNKIYLQSYSTSSYNGDSNSQKLVTSKYYVDDQLNQLRAVISAIGGSAGAGLSGIAALSAGLSAEGAAIRAESDSKYLFRGKLDMHSGGGLTFSGGPYKFTSGSPVVFSGSSVGVGAWFSSASNTPLSTLHVSGAGARITIQDTTFGTTASFQIMAQTNNSTKLFRIYDVGATPAVDLLCIKPDGNVGIGNEQSPLAKLHIKTPNIEVSTLAAMNSFSNYSLVLDATNAVGINNTPMFNGSGIAFKGQGALPFASIFYGGDGQGGSLHFATSTTYSAGLNKINMSMRNGNVGIGLTVPATRLHVVGTQNYGGAANSGILTVGNAGNTRQINFGVSDTNSVVWIEGWVPGTGGSDIVLQPTAGGGKVGIGTVAPSATLDVMGDVKLTQASSSLSVAYTSNDTHRALLGWNTLQLGNNGQNRIVAGNTLVSGYLEFWVNNTTELLLHGTPSNGIKAMTIASTGNVGIGVASPAVGLDISGEARSSTSTIATSNAKTLATKDYVDSVSKVGSTAIISFNVGMNTTGSVNFTWGDETFTVVQTASGQYYTSSLKCSSGRTWIATVYGRAVTLANAYSYSTVVMTLTGTAVAPNFGTGYQSPIYMVAVRTA